MSEPQNTRAAHGLKWIATTSKLDLNFPSTTSLNELVALIGRWSSRLLYPGNIELGLYTFVMNPFEITLYPCIMKYFHDLILIFLVPIGLVCSTARAQYVGVLGEVGTEFDMVQRLTGGGYVVSSLVLGTEVISRFDPDMQCTWTKEVQFPGSPSLYPVLTAANANGDITILKNSGDDPSGMDDTSDVRIDLVRLNGFATPIWSKRLHFRSSMFQFVDYRPMTLRVNDIGESFVVLRKSTGLPDKVMIRIAANGEVLWMKKFLEDLYVVDGFIPNGSTDCYFSCTDFANSGPLALGLIDASGDVQWTKRITYPAGLGMNDFHFCVGTDEKLLVGGVVSTSIFLLKVGVDGMPEWFRLTTPLPPTGLGVGTGLYAIEPTTYGYMLVRSAGNPGRSVVQYHSSDGSLLEGFSTTMLTEGEFTKRLSFVLSGSVGDEFTMAGSYVVHNTLFNQFVIQPSLVTLPPQLAGECFFGDETFAELPVALSGLVVEDITITTFLPLPPVTDIDLILADLPLVVTAPICGSVGVDENTSVGPSVIYDPASALATVRGVAPGQRLSLHNVLGQDVGSWNVQSNTIEVPLANLSAGPVFLSVQSAQGEMLFFQKMVVVK